jgi:valyl-tRNA synthetase
VDDLKQDEDVLDTWFSSWLWPFATLGWPNETRELKTFYPTTVLDTGYDILFFWVARMMMAGLHFMKKVPFRTVYLHTMVTDEKGEKMSKVKGNTIDPVDVIGKHGADALRFALAWLTTSAAQGKNIKFSMGNVEDARRFANKIWNATRFAMLNLEGFDADRYADRVADGPDRAEFDLPERWILSRVQRATEEVDKALEEHRVSDAAQAVYHFIWDEVCDWYIELGKSALIRAEGNAEITANPEARFKIQGALVTALETAMRLLHPFMPFITEELWAVTAQPERKAMLALSDWPSLDGLADDKAEAEIGWVIDLVTAIRSIRAEMNVTAAIPLVLAGASAETRARATRWADFIKRLARVSEISSAASAPHGSVQLVVRGEVAALPLKGVIDLAAERTRLGKEMAKADSDIARVDGKLNNANFVARAPEEVVEEEKEKREEAVGRKAKIAEALERLKGAV